MRYAVLSDVHANLEALTAAAERMLPDDGVLCLGDVVGYGPNPNECVAWLREHQAQMVLGNHDVAAIDNFGLDFFNPAARAAIEWTQGVLLPENRGWLDGLGYEFRAPDFLLVHGAPVNYWEYVLDKGGAARAFAATDAPLIFIGHTHIAEVYALEPDGTISHAHLQQGGVVALREQVRYLVNVGSLGQPRDLNPLASFGFFDTDARTISVERIAYPVERVQEKIRAAGLPEALARRLSVGR